MPTEVVCILSERLSQDPEKLVRILFPEWVRTVSVTERCRSTYVDAKCGGKFISDVFSEF